VWPAELMPLFSTKRRSPNGFDFPSIDFPTVDVDQAVRELRIEERALANGAANLPGSDATQLDGPQQQIVAFVRGETARIRAGFARTLKGLNRQIDQIDVRRRAGLISNLPGELRHDLQDVRDRLRAPLVTSKEAYHSIRQQLELFRTRNELDRDAEYPEPRIWNWAILAVVLVLEAGINAVFFQRGLMGGYVAGVVLAILLALVDVLAMFLLGRGAAPLASEPFRRDRPPLRTVLASAAVVAGLAWASLYNLLTAHVREQLGAVRDMTAAMRSALEAFLGNPLGLEQADSWILAAAGVLFSLLALGSGVKWDEPYPGYGSLTREVKRRLEEYEFHRTDVYAEAAAERDKVNAECDQFLGEAQEDLVVLQHMIDTKEALLTAVRECIQHYGDAAEALLRRYRDANQKARQTKAPKYFNEPVGLELPPPLDDSTSDDHARLAEQKTAFDTVLEAAAKVRHELTGEYQAFLAEMGKLERSRGRPPAGQEEESA
jgi:hypothetical protein